MQKRLFSPIGKQHDDIQIKLGEEVLDQVTEFVGLYLGLTLTEDGRCTEDIRRTTGLACAVLGKLNVKDKYHITQD